MIFYEQQHTKIQLQLHYYYHGFVAWAASEAVSLWRRDIESTKIPSPLQLFVDSGGVLYLYSSQCASSDPTLDFVFNIVHRPLVHSNRSRYRKSIKILTYCRKSGNVTTTFSTAPSVSLYLWNIHNQVVFNIVDKLIARDRYFYKKCTKQPPTP